MFRASEKPSGLSVYIHWPYCVSKCPYCDFNSGKLPEEFDEDAFVSACEREIEYYGELLRQREVVSVYFGGGTPSLMKEKSVAALLNKIAAIWIVKAGAEITLEANPSSSEAVKFKGFRAAGVNRLSLGVQSLRDEALKFLGRAHNVAEAKTAIELAAKNFPRYSFDLIYARQSQSVREWEMELREAIAMGAKHMSLYQLTIEPGTGFHKQAVQAAAEYVAADMYEATVEIMRCAGLPQYEISNFAAEGEESVHNQAYWKYEPYVGIGPGAHGRVPATSGHALYVAAENLRNPAAWTKKVLEKGNGLKEFSKLDMETSKKEALIMGLRLTKGIDARGWKKKFGSEITDALPEKKIKKLRDENLLAHNGKYVSLTGEGIRKLDAVLSFLLA